MAEAESVDSENEWEETLMMLQLPSKASTNKIEGNSYCQILGISSEQPLVKIKNHMFTGQLSQTMGTHLFLEVDDKSGSTQAKRNEIKSVTMSEKTMVLDPVYLEAKKDKTSQNGKATMKDEELS
ncbi:proteinral transcription factor 3c polypeptide [Elysia marginata]|uniref:Proteinral transcription factor 3c polypeptide n=1 Tax=Elysia marginata TaxID=1093978 RepID=A0AAV4JB32_9GAST|nr:proteinral transcription factor 3c polypeptide [Elysia marginata]